MYQYQSKKKKIIDKLLALGLLTEDEALTLSEKEINLIPLPQLPFPNWPAPIPNPTPLPINQPSPFPINDWINKELDRRARIVAQCPCNPANGGSGVCGCINSGPITTC